MATVNVWTVGTNGRDYATLTAWEAGRQGNLVSLDTCEVAECYNDGVMNDAFSIVGWTTDSTHYIKIYTPQAERHDGTYGSGFRLRYTGAACDKCCEINEDYVRVEGVEFDVSAFGGGSLTAIHVNTVGTSDIRMSHNIIYGGGTAGTRGIIISDADATVKIWNNIVYRINDNNIAGIHLTEASAAYVYNNTVYNCGWGILKQTVSTILAKNNACFANADGDFYGSFGSSDYNCSSDTTAPGSHSLKSKSAASNFVSVGVGTEDFHILGIGADLYGNGADLSSDPYLSFYDDIDAEMREHWDIGADEYDIPTGGGTGGGEGVSKSEFLAKQLYSVWKHGLITIQAECEMVDVMAAIGDVMTIYTGNPEITYTPIITGVEVSVGQENRVILTGVAGGYQYDEDNVFSSSSSSQSVSSSSSSLSSSSSSFSSESQSSSSSSHSSQSASGSSSSSSSSSSRSHSTSSSSSSFSSSSSSSQSESSSSSSSSLSFSSSSSSSSSFSSSSSSSQSLPSGA